MTVTEVLKRARRRLETPEHWCQGSMVLTATGASVCPSDPDACSYCLWGAVEKDAGYLDAIVALLALERVQADLVAWQDQPGRAHAEVLNLIDRTIAAQGEKAA